jgi:hypothetical protein
MENLPAILSVCKPIGKSVTTRTTLLQAYKAPSGFTYQLGLREASGLYIFESFAEGVGCSYLDKIMVFFGDEKRLIAEVDVPRGTRYTREQALASVKQKLCDFFYETCSMMDVKFSRAEVEEQVTDILDKCYFSESRQAVLQWAKTVNII